MKYGTLYIIATPIGNLEDITLRAIRLLSEVSLIGAEDTRRTKILLEHYSIKTPTTSLFEQNEERKTQYLIAHLKEGRDVAYVSDAGTPGISDPGYTLVREAIDSSIDVVTVPGPSAVIAALSVSGLPLDSFSFHAFLPNRKVRRREFLASVKAETGTLVFYESPRRIIATLTDIRDILGNRDIVVARELTKIYEENIRGPVSEVLEKLRPRVIKGEICLIVAGSRKTDWQVSPETIQERILDLQYAGNLSLRDIVDKVSRELGAPRKTVYKEALNILKKNSHS